MTPTSQQIAEALDWADNHPKPMKVGQVLAAAYRTALSDSKRKDEEIAGLREKLATTERAANYWMDGAKDREKEAADFKAQHEVEIYAHRQTWRAHDGWKARAEAAESRLKDAEAALAEEKRLFLEATKMRQEAEQALAEARSEIDNWKECSEDAALHSKELMAERDRLAGENETIKKWAQAQHDADGEAIAAVSQRENVLRTRLLESNGCLKIVYSREEGKVKEALGEVIDKNNAALSTPAPAPQKPEGACPGIPECDTCEPVLSKQPEGERCAIGGYGCKGYTEMGTHSPCPYPSPRLDNATAAPKQPGGER